MPDISASEPLDYPVSLLARVLEAKLSGLRGEGPAVTGICTDSRRIQPGDLFVALAGERFDGHHFAAEALRQGAAAVLVRHGAELPPAAGGVLQVEDPLRALGELAAWHRNRFTTRVVAVTGSVGKTTTKDFLHAVLSSLGPCLKSPGNLNAEIGLPLTLLGLRRRHRTAVVEMAMRGPGQIRYLARIARAEAAVITRIGSSHLELLGSRDAIAAAKAEVLDFLPAGGLGVLPAGDDYFRFLRGRVPVDAASRSFGMMDDGPAPDVRGWYAGIVDAGGQPSGAPLGRMTVTGLGSPHPIPFQVPLPGSHNAANALAALVVGQAFGVSATAARRSLLGAEVAGMRMSIHRTGCGLLIDDAYNASSPEAMQGALDVLRELTGLRKVAILGRMLELGPQTEAAHLEVGRAVVRPGVDLLITVGAGLIAAGAESAGFSRSAILECADNDEAVRAYQAIQREGDVVLVKGSRGARMESVVAALRKGGLD